MSSAYVQGLGTWKYLGPNLWDDLLRCLSWIGVKWTQAGHWSLELFVSSPSLSKWAPPPFFFTCRTAISSASEHLEDFQDGFTVYLYSFALTRELHHTCEHSDILEPSPIIQMEVILSSSTPEVTITSSRRRGTTSRSPAPQLWTSWRRPLQK